jgi:hypothetical protein
MIATVPVLTVAALLVAACGTPVDPTTAPSSHRFQADTTNQHAPGHVSDANPATIAGWFDGGDVTLHYTKAYYCAEPPGSGAATDCEIGAPAEVPPRPAGPIPTIYAIAAVGGIQPDPGTVACPPGSACMNHPAMIDLSRIGGPSSAPPVAHSHIVTERRGGWFNTVNIRVRSLDAWNQIAAAKTLAKVRALQADPEVGGAGLISPDTPTNIYFFIAAWH